MARFWRQGPNCKSPDGSRALIIKFTSRFGRRRAASGRGDRDRAENRSHSSRGAETQAGGGVRPLPTGCPARRDALGREKSAGVEASALGGGEKTRDRPRKGRDAATGTAVQRRRRYSAFSPFKYASCLDSITISRLSISSLHLHLVVTDIARPIFLVCVCLISESPETRSIHRSIADRIASAAYRDVRPQPLHHPVRRQLRHLADHPADHELPKLQVGARLAASGPTSGPSHFGSFAVPELYSQSSVLSGRHPLAFAALVFQRVTHVANHSSARRHVPSREYWLSPRSLVSEKHELIPLCLPSCP